MASGGRPLGARLLPARGSGRDRWLPAARPGATRMRPTIFSRLKNRLASEVVALHSILKHGIPDKIVSYPGGIGDTLLCTVPIEALAKANPQMRIWVITHYPEIFNNNPSVYAALRPCNVAFAHASFLEGRVLDLAYTQARRPGLEMEEDVPPVKHILEIMCARAGVACPRELKPRFYLSGEDKPGLPLPGEYVVVQSIGPEAGSAMRNKLWPAERYQEVVDQLHKAMPRIEVVQLGGPKETPLKNVLDLRGRNTIRETGEILAKAQLYIGGVGFLMHMARAVECPAVIIYGGREHAWQSGYPCNENIETHLPCSPCWKWNRCDIDRECMKMITVEMVLQAVQRLRNRLGQPLEVETYAVKQG